MLPEAPATCPTVAASLLPMPSRRTGWGHVLTNNSASRRGSLIPKLAQPFEHAPLQQIGLALRCRRLVGRFFDATVGSMNPALETAASSSGASN